MISAMSPIHLRRLDLYQADEITNHHFMNYLFEMALYKLPLMLTAFVSEKWRIGIFNGTKQVEEWNDYWWELKQHYEGFEPMWERSPADFDPAAKFHIICDYPIMNYFLANIIQFQLFEVKNREAKIEDNFLT